MPRAPIIFQLTSPKKESRERKKGKGGKKEKKERDGRRLSRLFLLLSGKRGKERGEGKRRGGKIIQNASYIPLFKRGRGGEKEGRGGKKSPRLLFPSHQGKRGGGKKEKKKGRQ